MSDGGIRGKGGIVLRWTDLVWLAIGIMFTPISDDVLLLTQLGSWSARSVPPLSMWFMSWSVVFISFTWFYVLARFFREIPFVKRWMSSDYLERAERVLARYGTLAIGLAFFIPGVRHPIHYVAGLLRFPFPTYLVVNAIAAGVYTAVWTFFVHHLGQSVTFRQAVVWVFDRPTYVWMTFLGIVIISVVLWKYGYKSSSNRL